MSALPEGIESDVEAMASRAIEEAFGGKAPRFSKGFEKGSAALRAIVEQRWGTVSQDSAELIYVEPGAFAYDYGRVYLFNHLQRPAFEKSSIDGRAIFVPHCLQNRKKCTAEECDRFDRCGRCGACAIAGICDAAEESGYDMGRVFIVGGASVIAPIIATVRPSAVVGVACMEELGGIVDRISSGWGLPPSQMALLRRRGCRNTRLKLSDIEAIL